MNRYFVLAEDGQVYGPADIPTLNQWILEGRLLPTTLLQPEGTTLKIAASTVQGLVFPTGHNFAAFTPQAIADGKNEMRGAYACLAVTLLCFCSTGPAMLAGLVGLIMGYLAHKKGQRAGLAIGVLCAIAFAFHLFMYRQAGSAISGIPGLSGIPGIGGNGIPGLNP